MNKVTRGGSVRIAKQTSRSRNVLAAPLIVLFMAILSASSIASEEDDFDFDDFFSEIEDEQVESEQIEVSDPQELPADPDVAAPEVEAQNDTALAKEPSKRRLVIEEVVVTAQKRSESIRDVPLSVSVLDGEALRESNIENANDLSLMTPNVKFNVTPSTTFINIRGLGTGENKGFEQSVGLIVDGVYYGRGDYLIGGMLDMQRIEVLRGPQGTLFGKNTIAGALNITTGSPEQELEGDFSMLMGDYDQQRYSAMLTGPITDSLGFRVALSSDVKDGYIYNTEKELYEANLDNIMGRAKLQWDILDTVGLEYSYSKNEVQRQGSGTQLSQTTDDSLALYRQADPETETDDSNFRTSKDYEDEGGTKDIQNHTLNLNWDIGDYSLTSISGTSNLLDDTRFDADFSAIPLLTLDQEINFSQFSEEIRLVSPPGEFEYVVGLYYFESSLKGDAIISSAPDGDAALAASFLGAPGGAGGAIGSISDLIGAGGVEDKSIKEYDQDTTTKAIFGQATWWVNDQLSLLLGYRYGRETKQMDQSLRFQNTGVLFQGFLNESPYDESNTRKEIDRSPKFSIKYDINDEINVYGTYAKGFKSGGFNPEAPNDEVLEYEAEKAVTFELGSKMRLMGGAMTLNLGLFDTTFDNLQVSLFDGTSFFVGNAAAVRTRGLEMDSMILLAENLVFTLSTGYTDARYTTFRDGPCWSDEDGMAGPNPRERDENGSCKQDLTGQVLSRAPKWNGSLGVQYHFGFADWPFRIVTGANVLYQDDYFLTIDIDPIDSQSAYTQYNAQLGLRSLNESWSLMFYGRNLTNEVVRIEAGDLPLFEGDHYSFQDLPRTISAEFRFRWQ